MTQAHRRPGRPAPALAVLTVLTALIAVACSGPTPGPAPASPTGRQSSTPSPTPTSAVPPGTYTNPVFAHDAPDPGVVRAPDGTYYAYTTQSIYLDLVETPILRSTDLVHWRRVGTAFPHAPDWVLGGPAGDVWAPHPLFWRGRYLLYYAGRQLSDGSMAIGVATSRSPTGQFHDLGHPLLQRQPGQPTYTAIDAFVLAEHGRLWLYWGSNDEPIRVARLDANGTKVVGKAKALVTPVPTRGGYGGLVEGAWVLAHGGWYYLFSSVGDCCSERANYTLAVARSKHPDGPFTDGPGNPILARNSHFWAPGHNATAVDDAGTDWLLYHARDLTSVSDDRLLMLDRIDWSGGWPTVDHGRGPSWTPQKAPQVDAR